MNREEGRRGYIEYPCILQGFFLGEGRQELRQVKELQYIGLFVCFLGVPTLCGCIFHSPVAGFSLPILEVS